MSGKKIIKQYKIEGDDKIPAPSAMTGSAANIIKKASITTQNREIKSSDVKDKKPVPTLKVNKNEHGIITTLEITCACGEQILIALDYE